MLLGLGHDPDVGLVAIVDGVGVWVLGRQAIVDRENGDSELEGPLARVVLVRARVLATEATSVEVDYGLIECLSVVLGGHRLSVKQANLDMSARIVPRFPQMELRTFCSYLFCSVLGQLPELLIGHIVVGQ